MDKRVKVFIIDESSLVRYALGQLINEDPGCVVCGSEAPRPNLVDTIAKAEPNILILDVHEPRESSLSLLKKIHTLHLPVVVFTKSDDTIARDLIPLLEAGAVGFVLKPKEDADINEVKEQLIHEIQLNTKKVKFEEQPKLQTAKELTYLEPLKVIAIGSSTGGPEALTTIIPQIPADFPYGIVIVQHMPAGFTERFAQRLDKASQIRVKEAQNGDVVTAGMALLAPGDFHMEFREVQKGQKRLAVVELTKEPPMWGLRPTVDTMMRTIAPIYQRNCIGIVLTGMGDDGVIGTREVKKYGGYTIVQNRETSAVFGMAMQVIRNNLADEVLPLTKIIPRAIEKLR